MKLEDRLYGCGCKKGVVATTPATTTTTTTTTTTEQSANITPTVQPISGN